LDGAYDHAVTHARENLPEGTLLKLFQGGNKWENGEFVGKTMGFPVGLRSAADLSFRITLKWGAPSRRNWSMRPYSQSRYACMAAAEFAVPSYGLR
jgi:hypothetical protein